MHRNIKKAGIFSAILALLVVSGSTAVLALPANASVHAQAAVSSNPPTSTTSESSQGKVRAGAAGTNANSNGQQHLTTGLLKACENRQNAIKTIITRIDTRAQNQLTLFSTIATRVESFYSKQGKALSNYNQLVAATTAAQAQANTDLGTMKTNSSFSCSASNPKGMVSSFQTYLKTEITDLRDYRTAVKNLIVAVASVNGVTLSNTNQASTSQGGSN